MSDYDWDIPEHLKESLDKYIRIGLPTGGFLRAVLCNDLFEACVRADPICLESIKNIVSHVNEYVPATAWGNERSMKEWIKLGGLEKKKATEKEEDDGQGD